MIRILIICAVIFLILIIIQTIRVKSAQNDELPDVVEGRKRYLQVYLIFFAIFVFLVPTILIFS